MEIMKNWKLGIGRKTEFSTDGESRRFVDIRADLYTYHIEQFHYYLICAHSLKFPLFDMLERVLC